jgi:hypothetical protein
MRTAQTTQHVALVGADALAGADARSGLGARG